MCGGARRGPREELPLRCRGLRWPRLLRRLLRLLCLLRRQLRRLLRRPRPRPRPHPRRGLGPALLPRRPFLLRPLLLLAPRRPLLRFRLLLQRLKRRCRARLQPLRLRRVAQGARRDTKRRQGTAAQSPRTDFKSRNAQPFWRFSARASLPAAAATSFSARSLSHAFAAALSSRK